MDTDSASIIAITICTPAFEWSGPARCFPRPLRKHTVEATPEGYKLEWKPQGEVHGV